MHVSTQRCTLHCGNVAGTSFSQRCENNLLTTLYNVVFTLCVCWDRPGINTFMYILNELYTILYFPIELDTTERPILEAGFRTI